MNARDVTVVIPTYNRGAILVENLARIVDLEPPPFEIVVVDQTKEHPAEVEARLAGLWAGAAIRWIRLEQPSIPFAMNEGLLLARTPIVLFLDDDVSPVADLAQQHAAAYRDARIAAVIGQCLQPGETPVHDAPPRAAAGVPDLELRFNHDEGRFVRNVIAMNLSVRRERALAIGGFDENFIGVAYRFETDFALRLTAGGDRIWFEPAARVDHLRMATGGTRAFGDHRTTTSPLHAVGDYYFALHHASSAIRYVTWRLRRNVLTRFHATHPWTIPGKLIGELRGLLLARRLFREGRRLIGSGRGILHSAAAIPRDDPA